MSHELAKKMLVTRMLTHDLFAVANFLVTVSEISWKIRLRSVTFKHFINCLLW